MKQAQFQIERPCPNFHDASAWEPEFPLCVWVFLERRLIGNCGHMGYQVVDGKCVDTDGRVYQLANSLPNHPIGICEAMGKLIE